MTSQIGQHSCSGAHNWRITGSAVHKQSPSLPTLRHPSATKLPHPSTLFSLLSRLQLAVALGSVPAVHDLDSHAKCFLPRKGLIGGA